MGFERAEDVNSREIGQSDPPIPEFGVQSSQGLGRALRVLGSGFRIQGLGFGVFGPGFGVQDYRRRYLLVKGLDAQLLSLLFWDYLNSHLIRMSGLGCRV